MNGRRVALLILVYGVCAFVASLVISRTLGSTAQLLFIPVVMVGGVALGTWAAGR